MTQRIVPIGYVSVTEVLNPWGKLHLIDPNVLSNAADRGTRVHNFCTLYARNLLLLDPDADCKPYVDAFKQWFDKTVTTVAHLPQRINSEKLKLSGEFDMIVKMKGDDGLTLLDIKTPQNASASWALQTAGYRKLVHDELGLIVHRRIVVMLPKTRGQNAYVKEYLDHDRDERLFLNNLELYRFFYG
jgi:hypothetical protein